MPRQRKPMIDDDGEVRSLTLADFRASMSVEEARAKYATPSVRVTLSLPIDVADFVRANKETIEAEVSALVAKSRSLRAT